MKKINHIKKQVDADSGLISATTVRELLSYGSVRLSMDGNCGCALLGENIEEGEVEFVEIDEAEFNDDYNNAAKRAMVRALKKLTERCYPDGKWSLPYNVSHAPEFQA